MAISKIIVNSVTKMDVTSDTVDATNLLSGYTALKNDGTDITGTASAGPTVLVDSVTISSEDRYIYFSNISSLPSFCVLVNSTTNTINKEQTLCFNHINPTISPITRSPWAICCERSGKLKYESSSDNTITIDNNELTIRAKQRFQPGTYILYYIM